MKTKKGSAYLILPLFAISIYENRYEFDFGWLNWTWTIILNR